MCTLLSNGNLLMNDYSTKALNHYNQLVHHSNEVSSYSVSVQICTIQGTHSPPCVTLDLNLYHLNFERLKDLNPMEFKPENLTKKFL